MIANADPVERSLLRDALQSAGALPSSVHLGLETPRTRSGGLNHYLSELCRALRVMGAPVEAVVTGDKGSDVSSRESFPFAVSTSAQAPIVWRIFRMWTTAIRVGRESNVVDCHFALSGFLPTHIGPLRRLPLVVHFQGPWADESALVGASWVSCWVKRQIERSVYGRATSIVVLSRAFGRLLVERYGVDPWTVNILPPGVTSLIPFCCDRAPSSLI